MDNKSKISRILTQLKVLKFSVPKTLIYNLNPMYLKLDLFKFKDT